VIVNGRVSVDGWGLDGDGKTEAKGVKVDNVIVVGLSKVQVRWRCLHV